MFEEDEPFVIAINAGWGEGKTFFWKNEYVTSHDEAHIGYVSVFGMESINDIRQHVLAEALSSVTNNVVKKVGVNVKPSWAQKLKILNVIEKVRENWNYFASKITRKLGLPESLTMQILEDEILKPGWILCLDDIERLSIGINIDTFLGYINELKELRRLKIVLIYSDSQFNDNIEIFKKYHEKVIDRQLPFISDIHQRLRMVFNGYEDIEQNEELLNELARRAKVLKLKNIRLLKKLKRYYLEVISALPEPVSPVFKESTLLMLLLFICIRYRHAGDEVPGFEYLDNYSDFSTAWSDLSDESEGPEEQQNIKFNKLLSDYGYSHTDDFDRILIDFVNTDLLNNEKLLEEYNQFSQQNNNGQLEEQYRTVWTTHYHGTLEDNADVFCNEMIKATKNYIDRIPINNLDETLLKLEALGRNDDVIDLLDMFGVKRRSTLMSEDMNLLEPIRHAGLLNLYNSSVASSNEDTRSINEVVDSAMKNDVASQKDRKRLSEFTAEDYFNYFTRLSESRLTLKIKFFGTIASRISNPDDFEVEIEKNVREAAQQIAALNPINQLRMESMGLIDKNNVLD